MTFEKIKLNQLKPAEYNPRVISKEEQKMLSNNLAEFGLVDPIIVNLKKISGEWDYNKLTNVLHDLQVSHFNMNLTGFDEMELINFNVEDTLLLESEIMKDGWNDFTNDSGGNYEGKPHLKTPPKDGENGDEVLVNVDDVKHYVCPKCGHEW